MVFDNEPEDQPRSGDMTCQNGEGQIRPVRSMNSVVKASARSVRGSRVESARVANDIVNMLLQVTYHNY